VVSQSHFLAFFFIALTMTLSVFIGSLSVFPHQDVSVLKEGLAV